MKYEKQNTNEIQNNHSNQVCFMNIRLTYTLKERL